MLLHALGKVLYEFLLRGAFLGEVGEGPHDHLGAAAHDEEDGEDGSDAPAADLGLEGLEFGDLGGDRRARIFVKP